MAGRAFSSLRKSTSLAADLEAFVREHDLNERAVAILRDVSEEVLRAVLDQGSLRGCRDANAGCIGRVKRAQQVGMPRSLGVERPRS